MKKIFTLLVASMMAADGMAQMHGALSFAGASELNVASQNMTNESDTVRFQLASLSAGSITLPAMKGMSTIPSFTIENVAFTMGENHVVTMADQAFSAKVTVDNAEKTITGSSLTGTYNMADNSLQLKVVFKYGSMPFDMTYNIKSYYVKEVAHAISVSVGGQFTYTSDDATYQVRKYMDGDVQKMDVKVPTYGLSNTVMGDLTLGSYTIKGLTYDEEKGGFYRDYKDDGLAFRFTAEKNGVKTMDGDYSFNAAKANNILVKGEGNNVADIVNTFQIGAMPFAIVTTFNAEATGITSVENDQTDERTGDGKMYNIYGQVVNENYKGVVIVNGKKFYNK